MSLFVGRRWRMKMKMNSLAVHSNIGRAELIEHAVKNGEGVASKNGAFSTSTGIRTGRSPLDRFIVNDNLSSTTVDWGKVNQPINKTVFEKLWIRAQAIIAEKTHYSSDLQVGANKEYAIPVKVITELAWHNAFCCNMFIEREQDVNQDEWTLLNVTSLKLDGKQDGVNSDGAVIINLSERKVLLCGMYYAGEMKKAMFTVLNFFLPEAGVLPMHCAANCGVAGDVTLFFGLSGTGKTTLSADSSRALIGDDEHGWGDSGVFNFEGGCYAKCINLTIEREPVIYQAISNNAIMENVVLDNQGYPDYTDNRLSSNSRVAYPRSHIHNRVIKNQAGNPNTVIFLTCDLYGVLPPVSLLDISQAAYYFLSGYTALVGSTEVGSTSGIKPTFSTCFGAPFFPRNVSEYADLLVHHVQKNNAQVYLVNTGWQGGAYAKGGQRFSIPDTRRIVSAAISGELLDTVHVNYPGFNFKIPTHINQVESSYLDPRQRWEDQASLFESSNRLIGQFIENFKRFNNVSEAVQNAGPKIIV